MTVLLCSVFSILRYKEHRNILYLTWTGSSNPQLFRTGLYTYTLCLSVSLLHFTFFNLAVAVGVFVFFVYNVNNINFSGELDTLGINSVCSALCY